MKITSLKQRPSLEPKAAKRYQALQDFLDALAEKQLTNEFVAYVNAEIEKLNAIADSDPGLKKQIRKVQSSLSNKAISQLKIVPKNYYMTLGMAIGMAAFGIPLGLIFSISLDSFAFIGIGLPIGLGAGLAIGAGLDKKAEQEGRQLAFQSY